ncbi:hypothetical protein D9756_009433 [Leucocoprinus leucothites]|uniref:Yeast cell wall synthesis Kre9/Knh1-like N-terminal domain-containing protein n=1 Tax=Leucocoprinus leucothites TaxID=201217 RepID=A0A8H5FUJ8_9AGAR|nr:hypothetical protein D9756_009433 [Leucoagaricus leucothites]
MVAITFLAFAASLAGFAAADLRITSPSAGSWWVAKSANTLSWTCHDSPFANFTISMSNSNPSLLPGTQAIIPIEQNFDCSKTVTDQQSDYQPGTGYRILLSNPLNSTEVYAQSDEFEIKPLGSSFPPTSTAGGATATGSGSAAGSSGTSNGNGAASMKTVGLGVSVGMAAGIAYLM